MQRTGPTQCFCCKKFWGTGHLKGPQCDCRNHPICYAENCGKCSIHCKCEQGPMSREDRIKQIRLAGNS